MAVSYRKRFEGREEEVRARVKLLGSGPAMGEFGVRDSIAWDKYLTNLFDGKRPPVSTPAGLSDGAGLVHYIVAEIFHVVSAQESEINRLRAELAAMRQEKNYQDDNLKRSAEKLLLQLEEAKSDL